MVQKMLRYYQTKGFRRFFRHLVSRVFGIEEMSYKRWNKIHRLSTKELKKQIQKRLSDSKTARWTALIIVSFTMMCCYLLTYVISPLEVGKAQSKQVGRRQSNPYHRYIHRSKVFYPLNILLLLFRFF